MRWPDLYDFEVDSTPLPKSEVFPRGESARKARRAFWWGVVIGAVVGSIASAAFGETIQIGRTFINGSVAGGTTVSIAPSPVPGVLAVVTLDNRSVNDDRDNARRSLATSDVTVAVDFTWNANPVTGADRIVVIPPEGITCEPEACTVYVTEGLTGQVALIDWRGM